MSLELTFLIGYLYSTLIAAIPIYLVMHLMWEVLRSQAGARSSEGSVHPNEWQTFTIGVIERALYLTSIVVRKPEFIALWLTLKTVSQSSRWSKDDSGRAIYNNFLVGNGLSILFAFAGAGIIQWVAGPILEPKDTLADVPIILEKSVALAWFSAIGPLVSVFVLAGFMGLVLRNRRRKSKNRGELKTPAG